MVWINTHADRQVSATATHRDHGLDRIHFACRTKLGAMMPADRGLLDLGCTRA